MIAAVSKRTKNVEIPPPAGPSRAVVRGEPDAINRMHDPARAGELAAHLPQVDASGRIVPGKRLPKRGAQR